MLEPRGSDPDAVGNGGSENNTHLSLPYLGGFGICGPPEKQAVSCGYAVGRGLRIRLGGARNQLRAPVQHAVAPGNSQYVRCQPTPDTRSRATGGVPGRSSQMLRILTEMAGRQREELHHERAFALAVHRSSRKGVWAACAPRCPARSFHRPRTAVLHPGLVELNTALPDPPSCFKLRAQRRRFLARRRLVVGSPPAFEGPPQAKLLAPAASSAKSASCLLPLATPHLLSKINETSLS
jgi:hypothetical protein